MAKTVSELVRNDHLYSYFLSGRAWDQLTEIPGPSREAGRTPVADEVVLAQLGLTQGQRFLYLFDYGDELRHEVQVLGTFPPSVVGEFPHIVETRGEAPPQYGY